jgi:hypothetical protein
MKIVTASSIVQARWTQMPVQTELPSWRMQASLCDTFIPLETEPQFTGPNASALFLFKRAAREIEPALVEKIAELVRVRHPDS